MIALITGTHGMIAPRVIEELRKQNIEIHKFNRNKIDINNDIAVINYLNLIKPDLIFHLAYGPKSWAANTASYCKENNKKFIYISTVNVYGDTFGPLYIDSKVLPNDEYSNYKYSCEQAILKANSKSYIIRLGWQYDSKNVKHPNNMASYIIRTQKELGIVEASTNSFISFSNNKKCSKAIVEIALNYVPDLYLINSNFHLNFYETLLHVSKRYKLNANIVPINGENKNWIMVDKRVAVKLL